MSRLTTPLQAIGARLAVMFLMTAAVLRQRVAPLRAEPERGGMNTLEIVLLTVAAVAVAGTVVIAIGSAVSSRVTSLNP